MVQEYLKLTDIVNNRTDIPSVTGTNKFSLKLVVAHEGLAGNERVDEEAKRAAQGESNLPEALPLILRK